MLYNFDDSFQVLPPFCFLSKIDHFTLFKECGHCYLI